VNSKPNPDPDLSVVRPSVAETTRAVRQGSAGLVDPRAARADATWQASSFDLAQGLDVKVMESKLSRETLDELFRA
jgi:hypothetical protein